mgnify:CR=1 FL=1
MMMQVREREKNDDKDFHIIDGQWEFLLFIITYDNHSSSKSHRSY